MTDSIPVVRIAKTEEEPACFTDPPQSQRCAGPDPTLVGRGAIRGVQPSGGARRPTEVTVDGERIRLPEQTAEKVSSRDEGSAVFGNDNARGLIQGPIEQIRLTLRNVDGWERPIGLSAQSSVKTSTANPNAFKAART